MRPICETCRKSIALERFEDTGLCEACEKAVARRLAPLRTRAEQAEAEVVKLIQERDHNANAFVSLAHAVGGRVDVAGAVEDAYELHIEVERLRGELREQSEELAGRNGQLAAEMERSRTTLDEVTRLRSRRLSSALAAGDAVRSIMQTRELALQDAAREAARIADEAEDTDDLLRIPDRILALIPPARKEPDE